MRKESSVKVGSMLLGLAAAVAGGCGGGAVDGQKFDIRVPDRGREATEVTRVYGELVISAEDLRAGIVSADSGIRPWAAWWFPKGQRDYFDRIDFPGSVSDKQPGVLKRYDDLLKRLTGQPSRAAEVEATDRRNYDPNSEDWWGRCHAWAMASLVEPEPLSDDPRMDAYREVNGVRFTRGDLKGLIIKIYEDMKGIRYFGRQYRGSTDDDYQDLYADQFHRFVQAELFEKGRPFVMDKNPGMEVWSVPVSHGYFEYRRDSDPTVLHVQAVMNGGDPLLDAGLAGQDLYNYLGTKPVAYVYAYDLHGYPRDDGSFKVVYGEWKDPGSGVRSRDVHPDYVAVAPEEIDIRQLDSWNTEVDPKVVYRILGR